MLKDLIVVILGPTNIGLNATKLPHAIHLAIPDSALTMRVSLESNFLHRFIHVLLVRHAHLVVPRNLGITNLHPLGGTNEVLRLQERIAQDMRVGRHGDEFVSRKAFPNLVKEGAVVNLINRIQVVSD